jgi:hypothetical protein
MPMSNYYWQLSRHLNLGDRRISVERCPELQICKQVVSERGKQGWRSETLYFFENETEADDPTYTLKELLVEAEYRKALRERDAIEVEALSE